MKNYGVVLFNEIIFSLMLILQSSLSSPFVQIEISDLQIQFFSAAEATSYKSLSLYNNILSIGAKEILFRQNAENISRSYYPSTSWAATQSDKDRCKMLPQGNNGANCYNYIRTQQPYNSTHILLCGSNALLAQNAFLNAENGFIHPAGHLATPFCSYNPSDQGISIVGKNNNGEAIVAAVSRQQPSDYSNLVKNLPDSTFLFATQGKGKMLESDAHFVSSFRYQDADSGHSMNKLYFVFGEAVQEPASYKRDFGARIAQVCADDLGGSDKGSKWTTFLKAPLLCQSNEDIPFMFDKVTHSTFSKDGYLYATFTTQFKNPSPGDCAYDGMGGVVNASSNDFTPEFLSFVENYPLVASPVLPVHPLQPSSGQSGPIFSINDEYLTQIAIQRVQDIDKNSHTVIFISSKTGKLLKFVCVLKNGQTENRELSRYDLGSEEILGLLLSDSLNTLYVETMSKVVQLSTGNCEVYSKPCHFCDRCRMCILARDPMCAWSTIRKECVDIRFATEDSSLRQDVTYGDVDRCEALKPMHEFINVPPIGRYEVLGEAVEAGSTMEVTWFNNTKHGGQHQLIANPSSDLYRISSDQLLEIKNFSAYDIATYIAQYRIENLLVAIKSTSYTDKVSPVQPTTTTKSPDTAPPPPSKATTTNFLSSDEIATNEATDIIIGVTPSTSVASWQIIVPIIILIIVIISAVVVVWRLRNSAKRRFLINEKSKRFKDVTDSATPKAMYAKNKSNNSSKELVGDGDAVTFTDESKSLLSSFAEKQIAEVSPIVHDSGSIEKLDGGDEPVRPKARQKPRRAKSFQSNTIRVNLDNQNFKCHSIRRDKERGVWLMEVNFPEEITFDDHSAYGDSEHQDKDSFYNEKQETLYSPKHILPSTKDESQKSLTLPASESTRIAPVRYGDADARKRASLVKFSRSPLPDFRSQFNQRSQAEGDASLSSDLNTASQSFDRDTDSDSTIKAPQSSFSSTASTPRSEGNKDSKASLSLPLFGQHPELGLRHIDSIDTPDSLPPPKRRGSARSEKSPSSTGSSVSHSSADTYRTPPASPIKKNMN